MTKKLGRAPRPAALAALLLAGLGLSASALGAQAAKPQLSVPGGGPGTKVTVSMKNLAIGDSIEVGFGTFAEHQILASASEQVDRTGAFTGTVSVPADAVPGPHYFFVAHRNGSAMAVSEAFLVTRADGTVRVRGQVSAAGPCVTLKGIQDELYALSGKIGTPEVGAKLSVDAKLGVKKGTCAGVPLEVTAFQVQR